MPAAQQLLFADPQPLVERLGRDFFRTLPESAGVYLMRDACDRVLYVGKAKNLRQRLRAYRVANPDRLPRRHLRLLRAVERIELQECASESAALARESELLRALKPQFNRAGTWPGKPSFLNWRSSGGVFEFAITDSAEPESQAIGPHGRSLIYLRAAVVRWLWLATEPARTLAELPAGWLKGKMDNPVKVQTSAADSAVRPMVEALLSGRAELFCDWVRGQKMHQQHPFTIAVLEADLEFIADFFE